MQELTAESDSLAKILIVDDESSIRSLLAAILSDKYSCTLAESAEEALSFLGREKFDLVISDINMGGMSGIELTENVVKLSPDTVVMMISGNQMMDSPIEALRSGAFDYIKKPFELAQVEVGVDRALKHAALLASKRQHENHLEQLVAERTVRLNYLAYNDSLTELPNRVYFEDNVSRTLFELGEGRKAAVLAVSMDQSKVIRDTLGHSVGDHLLKQVAERFKAVIGGGATVARFDGDEFALLLIVDETTQVESFADELINAFDMPFDVGGNEISIDLRMGISIAPDDCVDAQTLLKNAGAALSYSKQSRDGSYKFFALDLQEAAVQRLALENDLRHALSLDEFELFYQPKIAMGSGKLVGMEALIRWNHSTMGLVSPIEFIPVAEATGLIFSIGEWVIRQACTQTKSWHDIGYPVSVAVNLSPRQFQQHNLSEKIFEILQETGFDPQFLNLEITETSIMANAKTAGAILRELKEKGIDISIDDFGTGYSSLGVLKDLPVDVLKIDKSFVNDITTNPDDAALVTAVVTLAHNLRLKVVAEGVETEEQRQFLNDVNCDEWQGYLFGKPVSAEDLESLLVRYA